MSYFSSLESRFLSKVREDKAWAATWEVTSTTTPYGFMVDPGTIDMIASHMIITHSQAGASPISRIEWGFRDDSTGYGDVFGGITSMKSDGGTPAASTLEDIASAGAPTRIIGQMEVFAGGQTASVGEPRMVIPIEALVVADDFFVAIMESLIAKEISVSIYGYDAE